MCRISGERGMFTVNLVQVQVQSLTVQLLPWGEQCGKTEPTVVSNFKSAGISLGHHSKNGNLFLKNQGFLYSTINKKTKLGLLYYWCTEQTSYLWIWYSSKVVTYCEYVFVSPAITTWTLLLNSPLPPLMSTSFTALRRRLPAIVVNSVPNN